MIFDGQLGPSWRGSEKRTSCMVLIGTKLNTVELSKGFYSCLAPKHEFCKICVDQSLNYTGQGKVICSSSSV